MNHLNLFTGEDTRIVLPNMPDGSEVLIESFIDSTPIAGMPAYRDGSFPSRHIAVFNYKHCIREFDGAVWSITWTTAGYTSKADQLIPRFFVNGNV